MLVQASGLVKQYPRVRALDQVSLEIKEGEVFGLFGPNGAGKTTCLRVLSGLAQPDAGSATVCGIDVRAAPNEVRRELGIPRRLDPVHVPQSPRERGHRRPLRLPAPRADHRPRDRPGAQVDAPRAGL